MLRIDSRSPVPIFDQIKTGLRGLVVKGLLRPGDRAPSVRALASELKVNPNTVAKAFRDLTAEGLLETRRGEGCFVARGAKKKTGAGVSEARDRFQEAVRQARRSGLRWSELNEVLKQEKGGKG